MEGPEPIRDLRIWPCGCYYDRRVIGPDEFRLNMEVCSECFDKGMELLESLDNGDQLTLPLASSVSGTESDNGIDTTRT